MSFWIRLDASGTTSHGTSLVMVPNEPAVPFVTVHPVRSQPTAHGSASGDVQVATTSRMHTPQEVNLI